MATACVFGCCCCSCGSGPASGLTLWMHAWCVMYRIAPGASPALSRRRATPRRTPAACRRASLCATAARRKNDTPFSYYIVTRNMTVVRHGLVTHRHQRRRRRQRCHPCLHPYLRPRLCLWSPFVCRHGPGHGFHDPPASHTSKTLFDARSRPHPAPTTPHHATPCRATPHHTSHHP